MKKVNRLEKKFLLFPIELYRYDPKLGTCDAKHTFWFRSVKKIYMSDIVYGYWIDESLWMKGTYHSLFNKVDYRDSAITVFNQLFEFSLSMENEE